MAEGSTGFRARSHLDLKGGQKPAKIGFFMEETITPHPKNNRQKFWRLR
jgi:hypothetical protein